MGSMGMCSVASLESLHCKANESGYCVSDRMPFGGSDTW
jgi:hypothetical protein